MSDDLMRSLKHGDKVISICDPEEVRHHAYRLSLAVSNLVHHQQILRALGVRFDVIDADEAQERVRYALLAAEELIERSGRLDSDPEK